MKKIALVAALVAAPFAVNANTEEACKAAHKAAAEAGHKEVAEAMEAALKNGKFDECVALAPAAAASK